MAFWSKKKKDAVPMPSTEVSTHEFSTDRAISRLDQDELGRASYARSLADAIMRWDEEDSLVLGVCGDWGSGKTSLKNMILDGLSEKNFEYYHIAFNPWEWSSQKQVSSAFFHEIIAKLKKKKVDRKLTQRLKLYAECTQLGADLIDGFQKWLDRYLLLVVSAFGISWLPDERVKTWVLPIVAGLMAIGIVLKVFKQISSRVATIISKKRLLTDQSIEEVKQDVVDEMQKLDKRLLIVIDDIDRLTSDEICQLFQLVKVNADFPNTTYLLLLDPEYVATLLKNKGFDSKSREYIEKIINVHLDVPVIGRQQIYQYVSDEIMKFDVPWNDELRNRFRDIYNSGVLELFRSLRHVKRFLAALHFHWKAIHKKGTPEVNFADLFAIEAIRMMTPEVYKRIYTNREIMIKNRDQWDKRDLEQGKMVLEEVIKCQIAGNTPHVKAVIKKLFPNITDPVWGNGGGHSAGIYKQWYNKLQICCTEYFNRYFQFSVPDEEISQSDIAEVIQALRTGEKITPLLERFYDEGKLKIFVRDLRSRISAIQMARTDLFIAELSDLCEELSFEDELSGFNILSISSFVTPVVEALMTDCDESSRATDLKNGILGAKGLRLPVRIVARLEEKTAYVLRSEFLAPVQRLCVSRIEEHAKDCSLINNPDCQTILHFWGTWSGSFEEPKQWVLQCSQDDDLLPPLLRVFASHFYSSDAPGNGRVDYYDLDSLERYMPAEELEKRVAALDVAGLSNDNQGVVNLFYEDYKSKQGGEPYGRDRIYD